MTLEIGALQKARHPPAGLAQLSGRMCKLPVRVIPQKISLASSVISCEVYVYNHVHHLSVLQGDVMKSWVLCADCSLLEEAYFKREIQRILMLSLSLSTCCS